MAHTHTHTNRERKQQRITLLVLDRYCSFPKLRVTDGLNLYNYTSSASYAKISITKLVNIINMNMLESRANSWQNSVQIPLAHSTIAELHNCYLMDIVQLLSTDKRVRVQDIRRHKKCISICPYHRLNFSFDCTHNNTEI